MHAVVEGVTVGLPFCGCARHVVVEGVTVNLTMASILPPEPAVRMADIRDVTNGICKLRKTYYRK